MQLFFRRIDKEVYCRSVMKTLFSRSRVIGRTYGVAGTIHFNCSALCGQRRRQYFYVFFLKSSKRKIYQPFLTGRRSKHNSCKSHETRFDKNNGWSGSHGSMETPANRRNIALIWQTQPPQSAGSLVSLHIQSIKNDALIIFFLL